MIRRLLPVLAVLLTACPTVDEEPPREPYAPEHCAYFLTGEVDLVGVDADGDGVPNGWDHCPNNPFDHLDTDRDGIGNASDTDDDGDGVPDEADADRDGDGASNEEEEAAGTDPGDPAYLPGLPTLETDLGVFDANPGWYAGDLHVHTEYSHDSTEPVATWVDLAPQVGLDFLWITDHRTFGAPFDPSWDQDQVLLVPAIEWGGPGHANIGGIRTDVGADWDDPADVLRSWRLGKLQGSVQSLNHYDYDDDAEYWEGMLAAEPALLDELDTWEVWNAWWPASQSYNPTGIARWEQLLSEGYRLGAVGGSDTHAAALPLGFPTTMVRAGSLSVPGILDGVRRRHTYITQSWPYMTEGLYSYEGRARLTFVADSDGDGSFESMMGDVVQAGTLSLKVQVEPAHGPVYLVHNGEVVETWEGTVDELVEVEVEPLDFLRVEMRNGPEQDAAMLLFSSAIQVE